MTPVGILSHPFRLDAAGNVVTVDDGTTQAHAEAIAVLILTRPGERPMAPTFGVEDPTFAGIDLAELTAALSLWGPTGVRVTAVDQAPADDRTVRVRVAFDEQEPTQ